MYCVLKILSIVTRNLALPVALYQMATAVLYTAKAVNVLVVVVVINVVAPAKTLYRAVLPLQCKKNLPNTFSLHAAITKRAAKAKPALTGQFPH